jgi:hypothetical protein
MHLNLQEVFSSDIINAYITPLTPPPPGEHPDKFHILLYGSKTTDLKLPLKYVCQRRSTSPLKNLAFLYAYSPGFVQPGVHTFSKNLGDTSKILSARRVTQGKFHTQDPLIIRATIQILVTQVTWNLGFLNCS